ncbi:helix-turn-helix transcriptional regulator [Propionibacterium australiense]|uniref:Protein PafC n=1 Tax=Propionibacterium australiense TaxID=119981 RepID=A0A383SAP5_9ACTN|nr:WYL domain-containing protein [Propionibacterium australiense]SYZ34429.1 Protein PafC [Propionibacterium australiense]VEH89872.1 Proteasome accessory factor C [Propionibacterium australiense]
MSTSAEQVQRMLAEVPYLMSNPGATVDEVARTFGITPAQLGRDLQALWMCGLPGQGGGDLIEIDMDTVKDAGVIRLSNADYLSRPMRFTPDEAASLVVALRAVAELATGALADAAGRAGRTLETLVAETPGDRVDLRLSTGDETVRERLGQAIETGQRVRLVYDNASRGRTTRPLVDPAVIEVREGAAYLHAWSLAEDDPVDGHGEAREGWRTYRLDRVNEIEPTGEAAADHGDPPVQRPWFDDAQQTVTLDLAAHARWIIEYHPTSHVEELADGAVRAVFPVGDPGWVDGMLLRLGDQVLAVEPATAVRGARDRASAALELNAMLFGDPA